MPERVVVALEAVEIEHRQRHGPLGVELGDVRGEIGRQLASVAETGQGVGRGVAAAVVEQAFVVAHGQVLPQQDEEDRSRCRPSASALVSEK